MERQSIAGEDLQLNTKGSSGGTITVTNDGTFATPGKQDTQITAEQAIQASVASIDTKTPASPATSAKQDTGNTALTSIATSVADIDTATGTQADAAWSSGNGTQIAILKKIAGNTAAGGGAVSIADGADVTQGAKADVAWVSGDGTVIALLKKIASGTGGGGAVTVADGADVAEGAVADAAWVSGNGTVVAILKGIFGKLASVITALGSPFQAGGSIGNTSFASTVADGANVVEGTTTDAAVTTDASGTLQKYLRGIIKLFSLSGFYPPVANDWAIHHVPATNVKATITQASAGSGNRNICHGLTVTIASDATAPTVTAPLTVSLIDGASGGGTYLWRSIIATPGIPGSQVTIIKTFPKPIKGSQATQMTLEFSAAGGANTYESVSMNGSSITE